MDHESGIDRTSFIGREKERSFLIEELREGARLLTITGPSGMGKTRLARQVLKDLEPVFTDLGGAHFCSLAACQSSSDIEIAVARAIGPPARLQNELASEFASKGPALLVLDNVDTVASLAIPIIQSIMEQHGDLQLLLTSLEPVGMREELRFELGPLAPTDAVALYRDRIYRASVDWSVSAGDDALLEEVVGRLDRIPLAIELAAARVQVMPPKALLSRIDSRFELLQIDEPGRHGSLYEALSLSWELLSPEEKLGLARLSVFAGGFSLEAANAIAAVGQAEEGAEKPRDALRLLEGLQSKALIQLEEPSLPRFSIYESVRDFAAIHLRRMGEEKESIARHARFFLESAEHHASMVDGPEGLASIHWLMNERENLLAALRRTIDDEPLIAARIGVAFATVIELHGAPASELKILELILRAARAASSPATLIRALRQRAEVFARHGSPQEARRDLAEALDLAIAHGDRLQEGYILSALGPLRVGAGEHQTSVLEQQRALEIGRERDDPTLQAFGLLGLGLVEVGRRSFPSALSYFEEALEISRTYGNVQTTARALFNIGVSYASQGRYREAREMMLEVRARFRAIGNRAGEAYALFNQGGLEYAAGNLEQAEAAIKQAFRLEGAQSNQIFEAQGVVTLGLVALEGRDVALAKQRFLEAAGMYGRNGDRSKLARCLAYLAASDAMLGRVEEAQQGLEESRAFFREMADASALVGLDAFEAFIELERARQLSGEGAEGALDSLEARVRERLAAAAARKGDGGLLLTTGVRLLEKALDAPLRAPSLGAETLVVGADAKWFEYASNGRVDLRRRHSLRRILLGLTEQRLALPGSCLNSDELFRIGWRGEIASAPSAARRVYTAIWALRSMGLSAALQHDGEGYLLDPSLGVAWGAEEAG